MRLLPIPAAGPPCSSFRARVWFSAPRCSSASPEFVAYVTACSPPSTCSSCCCSSNPAPQLFLTAGRTHSGAYFAVLFPPKFSVHVLIYLRRRRPLRMERRARFSSPQSLRRFVHAPLQKTGLPCWPLLEGAPGCVLAACSSVLQFVVWRKKLLQDTFSLLSAPLAFSPFRILFRLALPSPSSCTSSSSSPAVNTS